MRVLPGDWVSTYELGGTQTFRPEQISSGVHYSTHHTQEYPYVKVHELYTKLSVPYGTYIGPIIIIIKTIKIPNLGCRGHVPHPALPSAHPLTVSSLHPAPLH